jgi:hypothetical protein
VFCLAALRACSMSMPDDRSMSDLIAEHSRRLERVREAAEAGDPESVAVYAEGVEVLNRARAAQAERAALLARTAQQQAQLQDLNAQIERLREHAARLRLLEAAHILSAAQEPSEDD